MRRESVSVRGCLVVLAAFAAGAASLPTSAADEPAFPDVASAILEEMKVRTGGRLPSSATVDAGFGPQEVPLEEALALARWAPDARAASGGAAPDWKDVGYGFRQGPNPCYVAAVVTAFRFTDGEEAPALHFHTPRNAIPQPTVRCGPGLASWLGDSGATVADGVLADACVAYEDVLGAWGLEPESCHLGDFREAEVHGRVGRLHIHFCEGTCLTLDQIFGGTVGSPVLGGRDTAVLKIR